MTITSARLATSSPVGHYKYLIRALQSKRTLIRLPTIRWEVTRMAGVARRTGGEEERRPGGVRCTHTFADGVVFDADLVSFSS